MTFNNREHLTSKDIVVVDEAGMLGSRQMAAIFDEVDHAGAKVALIGDPEQLQAIEAGAAYRAIAERIGFVEMTEIRRQLEPWQQEATRDFAMQQTGDGLFAYEQHDNVHTFNTKDSAMTAMIEQWDEVRSQSLNKSQIMLAYTRDEVRTLNDQARTMRHGQQELGNDVLCETSRGARLFAEQDRIYFLRNENRELRVKNGTLGTIEKIDEDRLTVRVDRSDKGQVRTVQFSLKDYNDLDHGYAATVYKAQGVTVDRSHILASKYFDRHSTYVAMSRHREGADLYYSREEFADFKELEKQLSRVRKKDVSLDYAIDKEVSERDASRQSLREYRISLERRLGTPERKKDMETRLAKQRERRAKEQRREMREFQKAYERRHPERAQALKVAVLPKDERRALEIAKTWGELGKAIDQESYRVRTKREALAEELVKSPIVRSYLARRLPEFAKQLQPMLQRAQQRIKDRGRGRDLYD